MNLIVVLVLCFFFFFSSRRRHTRCLSDWSSDVCSSDLVTHGKRGCSMSLEALTRLSTTCIVASGGCLLVGWYLIRVPRRVDWHRNVRSEEHTSELQSLRHLVCRLLLEKKKKITYSALHT